MATIRIRLVRGLIGTTPVQRRTLAALGLRKIRQVREMPENGSVLGMVKRVEHLVEVMK
jgi:large subunit ribosomal protein L30